MLFTEQNSEHSQHNMKQGEMAATGNGGLPAVIVAGREHSGALS